MYEPTYTITERLLSAIVKLETDRALMLHSDVPTALRTKFKEEAKGSTIFHLAHMLGLNITLRDAMKIAEGRKLGMEGDRAKLINNFRNVIEFNRSNVAESYSELDSTLLLHLNKILLSNWKEPWDVKLRSTGEQPDHNMDDWGQEIMMEQSVVDVQDELEELTEWFKLNANKIHPLIAVGVLVFRLGQLQPLQVANKLTIISVADFFMTRLTYTDGTFLPVTRVFDVYSEELQEAWEMSKQTFDATLWLERFARNISKDISDQKAELDQQMAEEKERNTKQPFLDLNKRQLKALKYLQTIPTLKREDYCAMMDVSTMTAYRDLDDLVNKKLIKVEGRGRGTKYMLISR